MYKLTRVLFLNVLTSLHAGGGSELGIVDLPIQREGHTGFPKIESSSLKGSLRNAIESSSDISEYTVAQIFGSEDPEDIFASAVAFSDVRLLFFPVRSAKGVFAFVTCPMVLRRFFNDMELGEMPELSKPFDLSNYPVVTATAKSDLVISTDGECKVMLEEYVYSVTVEKNTDDAFSEFLDQLLKFLPSNELLKSQLKSHAILVSDDDFADFVQLSTEVVTRIKIDNSSGTVSGQALFNEEYLPPESIMYSVVFISDAYRSQKETGRTAHHSKNAEEIASELEKCIPPVFQIGANQTLGKGFVASKLVSGGVENGQRYRK
ncbi:type III-B CRISPR module RAMP protein Cmr4 [Paenibacillus faecalis]|uniref:type III-B CRISPR module RAMP protein Cmr4 n=1 Tax=Paenibacillus faecalis TaxID=2079532 RepID=UPI001F3510D1|nr:type III-B CRISPR module RAMP protein Cmr4 [Paenibacillus faecalis]